MSENVRDLTAQYGVEYRKVEAERDELRELLGEDAGAAWFNLKAERDRLLAEKDEAERLRLIAEASEWERDEWKEAARVAVSDRVKKVEAAEAEAKGLREALDAASWYIECLENVQARKVVRGLAEAQAGWQSARAALTDQERKPDPQGPPLTDIEKSEAETGWC